MNKKKGIWFFGLSGSGKSFASEYIHKKIKKSIIIDGDVVRKFISFDLGYSIDDREIQIRRTLGIAKIIIKSNHFPIISTVWMNEKIFKNSINNGIDVIKIDSDLNKLIKKHKTYKNKKNVVGIDIKYNKNIKSKILYNNKDLTFWKTLKKLTQ